MSADFVPLRAISLWQPWASLLACGAKRIETRSWTTPLRGALFIHASMRTVAPDSMPDWPWVELLPDPTLALGAIVGVGILASVAPTDVVTPCFQERALGDYTPGRFAWIFTHARLLPKPIPCRGWQGIFRLQEDPALRAALERLFAEVAR